MPDSTPPEAPIPVLRTKDSFHIVDRTESRTIRYIYINYPTLTAALKERDDLLRHFPKGHKWRDRICVRSPGGKITNPDLSEEACKAGTSEVHSSSRKPGSGRPRKKPRIS